MSNNSSAMGGEGWTGLNVTCGTGVDTFHTGYTAVHGWASLIVCIFGSIANTLNIAVLTRREMRSPTNAILTGLAIADLIVMLEYIPYTVHSYLYHRPKSETYTYYWTLFVLIHSNVAQVFHTISIWLTVMLAVWRYIAVAYPQKNREWCSSHRALIAIIVAYVICPLICIPLYVSTQVESKNVTLDVFEPGGVSNGSNGAGQNVTYHELYFVVLTSSAKNGLKETNFWMYSVVIKLIPCVALTVLSLRLIAALMEAKKRRKKLTSTTMVKMEESANLAEGKKRKRKASRQLDKEKQTDRTTRMLLAVLLLFLLTEFPQGLLGLMSVSFGDPFFNTCYVKLGTCVMIMALVRGYTGIIGGLNYLSDQSLNPPASCADSGSEKKNDDRPDDRLIGAGIARSYFLVFFFSLPPPPPPPPPPPDVRQSPRG